MFGRRKAEIAELKTEIAILRERLCPFGQHDWSIVDSEYSLYAEEQPIPADVNAAGK